MLTVTEARKTLDSRMLEKSGSDLFVVRRMGQVAHPLDEGFSRVNVANQRVFNSLFGHLHMIFLLQQQDMCLDGELSASDPI